MIRIAVCDDNPAFAAALAKELSMLCIKTLPENLECRVLPPFYSASSVLACKDGGFDAIFLDIDMPEMSGFELAERIAENDPETLIVFVSAYDNFVYSSFAYSPFRFLRKSHLAEELPDAFEKVIERITQKTQVLSFQTTDGPATLRISDIVCFECDKNYYTAHTRSGSQYKCRGTITSLETVCTDSRFMRIHSSFIINLEHVSRVIDGSRAIMSNGFDIGISQRRRKEFKDAYMKMLRRRFSK